MSEFFKALEQAERDRLRQDQADAASATPVARSVPREHGTPENGSVTPEAAATNAPVMKAPVAEPSAAKAPVVEPPASRPSMFKRPASKPAVGTPPGNKPPVSKVPVARPLVAAPPAPPAVTPPPVAPAITPPVDPKPVAPAPPREPAAAEPPRRAPSRGGIFRPSLQPPKRSRFGRGSAKQPLLVSQSHPSSIEADAYRTLRANIELMAEDRAFRHIAITSAGGGDGKSTTAANLAVVAAQGGRRVCLVDADFRRPTLHDIFGLANIDGLTLALEHGKPLHTVAKPTDVANLSVVVAGRGAHESHHDVLTAQRLERLLQESEAAFDLVIFDSPPVIAVADALSVAAVCDGVILVVRTGRTPFGVLERAIGQIKQVKGRVLGVLLNQVDLRAADADSYRYYRAYHTTRKS